MIQYQFVEVEMWIGKKNSKTSLFSHLFGPLSMILKVETQCTRLLYYNDDLERNYYSNLHLW